MRDHFLPSRGLVIKRIKRFFACLFSSMDKNKSYYLFFILTLKELAKVSIIQREAYLLLFNRSLFPK